MPVNFNNLKTAMSDSKNRVVLLLILVAVFFAIFFSVHELRKKVSSTQGIGSAAQVAGAPKVESIPGVGDPTREYVKLQREQNTQEVERAKRTGTSAVPTIIQSAYLGKDDFGKALVSSNNDNKEACSVQALRRAKRAGVSAFELRCRGCDAKALRAAGYTAGELREAGFSAQALRESGFTAAELKAAGFNASELRRAGFSAQTLQRAGFSTGEIAAAGYQSEDLNEACDPEKLKQMHDRGVSALVARMRGCTAAALRAAGYTAKDLKAVGFSVDQLKEAGFSADALKAAGFSAEQLKAAGFSAEQLKAAGFSKEDLKAAGFSEAAIGNACNVEVLKRARKQGIRLAVLKDRGCSATALRAAGFTAAELKSAGFGLKALKAAGFSAEDLKRLGFPAKSLKEAGFSAEALKRAGFSANALKAAGFSRSMLKKAGMKVDNLDKSCNLEMAQKARVKGVSAVTLKERGCSAATLRQAGFSAGELKDAGFSAKELREAGFNAADLKAAGFSARDLREAGFSAKDLQEAGFSAAELRQAGFSAGELKRADFSASNLAAAGFSARQMRNAGFTADTLKEAGLSAEALKKAGYTEGSLLRAGFGASVASADINNRPQDTAGTSSVSSQADALAGLNPSASGEGEARDTELARIERRQAKAVSKREREQKMQALKEVMASQANDLISSWSPPSVQRYVQGVAEKASDNALAAQTLRGRRSNNQQGAATGPQDLGDALGGEIFVKAGSVMFAILETGINSDEPSPVMARIVQGELKNAKLLGQFKRQGEKVVLSFNRISIPGIKRSVSINAFAIDQNTARVALADHVDKHYWLRYGTLFASSFLSGLADAIGKSGTTSDFSEFGVSVRQEKLSNLQLGTVALGNVGKQYSTALSNNFNVPPTVHVRSGSGIGILFMQDLRVAKLVE